MHNSLFYVKENLVDHLTHCNPVQIVDILSANEDHLSICDNCDEEFENKDELLTHLHSCDPKQAKIVDREKEDRKHQCKFCGKNYKSLKCFENHEKEHLSATNNKSSNFKEPPRKKRKLSGEEKDSFQCPKCNCSFKFNSALERHLESHELAKKIEPTQADIEEGL